MNYKMIQTNYSHSKISILSIGCPFSIIEKKDTMTLF